MFKGRRRGRGNTSKAPLKGLFSDGVWRCNCDPRLPAEHFQTKNGGKNHVYTCQLPQPKRCDFFLWDDEAKPREAGAVLNNSRSEPYPETPKKPTLVPTLRTPYDRMSPDNVPYPPSKTSSVPRSISLASTQDEFFDWPNSDDDELSKTADLVTNIPPPETPRKTIKTDMLSTPGKRRFDEIDGQNVWPTPSTVTGDDIFTTPSTGSRAGNLFPNPGLISPAITPTPMRFKDTNSGQDLDLTRDILGALQESGIGVTEYATKAIGAVCKRQELFTKGVIKGRDISRSLIKQKEDKIAELQGDIAALHAERETNRAVIMHLRCDMENGKLQKDK